MTSRVKNGGGLHARGQRRARNSLRGREYYAVNKKNDAVKEMQIKIQRYATTHPPEKLQVRR